MVNSDAPTLARVIGLSVKQRREALGMTAAHVGEEMARYFGKPWPRQTVYMVEAGDRAMAAQEVAAFSQILDISIAELFTPGVGVNAVSIGLVEVEVEDLLVAAHPTARKQVPPEFIEETLKAVQSMKSALEWLK